MQVNQNTKIAALLKHHPQALDTIVSINPKFEKLRNPFLRRLMAGRTSIGMAARIAGCPEDDFYRALRPLGFVCESKGCGQEREPGQQPFFLQNLKPEQVVALDVRPVLERGEDPLGQILAAVKKLRAGQVLNIINSFEPTPLIGMLKKKGFRVWVNTLAPQHIETWFYHESANPEPFMSPAASTDPAGEDWHQVRERYISKLQEIDVRELEMPLPMHTILEALDGLPIDKALYVVHKRLPVFLLPELAQRGFEYRSRAISENEVHLLIFRA